MTRGLSQTDLAGLIPYSRTAIQSFERGERPDGKPIGKHAWARLRDSCLRVEMGWKMGEDFVPKRMERQIGSHRPADLVKHKKRP